MPRQRTLLFIAVVIALPIFFGLIGGTRDAGLAIGVVLVVAGLAGGLLSGRGSGYGRPGESRESEEETP